MLSVPTQEGRASLTNKIVEGNLTVREAENLARLLAGRDSAKSVAPRPATPPLFKS
ncbi:hypothetical protein PZH32_13505, partial [Adlercreutzia equolifaciens]|nr:hypothetical protein [Adlercreutzia equolifaciens]